jgi:hypothetical protein
MQKLFDEIVQPAFGVPYICRKGDQFPSFLKTVGNRLDHTTILCHRISMSNKSDHHKIAKA